MVLTLFFFPLIFTIGERDMHSADMFKNMVQEFKDIGLDKIYDGPITPINFSGSERHVRSVIKAIIKSYGIPSELDLYASDTAIIHKKLNNFVIKYFKDIAYQNNIEVEKLKNTAELSELPENVIPENYYDLVKSGFLQKARHKISQSRKIREMNNILQASGAEYKVLDLESSVVHDAQFWTSVDKKYEEMRTKLTATLENYSSSGRNDGIAVRNARELLKSISLQHPQFKSRPSLNAFTNRHFYERFRII
eukprot:NODE_145_length_17646_cov_0.204536.p5 type:complete len:251 gc:universal NODE_145_length_17646_cov_0.204536:1436-2188(+)